MKKAFAIIENGVVVNVVVGDDDWALANPNALEISTAPGSPGVGWTYDGSTFTPPAPPQEEP